MQDERGGKMRIGLVLAMLMLSACVVGAKDPKSGKAIAPPANPIIGDAISTTSLDAPSLAAPEAPTAKPVATKPEAASLAAPDAEKPSDDATEAKPKPKPTEEPAAEEPATEEPPPVPQSPAEAKCLKSGGLWASAGKTGAQACVQRTKDAGKRCTKQTQCEGFCLARSGTCAPITPMFGCNDILQADGRMVTLCLD